jgi:hypothetical protein
LNRFLFFKHQPVRIGTEDFQCGIDVFDHGVRTTDVCVLRKVGDMGAEKMLIDPAVGMLARLFVA